jgi:hypothetical protein
MKQRSGLVQQQVLHLLLVPLDQEQQVLLYMVDQ